MPPEAVMGAVVLALLLAGFAVSQFWKASRTPGLRYAQRVSGYSRAAILCGVLLAYGALVLPGIAGTVLTFVAAGTILAAVAAAIVMWFVDQRSEHTAAARDRRTAIPLNRRSGRPSRGSVCS